MTERGCAIRILIAIAPFIVWNAPQLRAGSASSAGTDNLPGVIDMSTIKRSDLLAMSEERQRLTLAWIRGYEGGLANDTRWDRAQRMGDAQTLAQSCEGRGLLAVMTVIGPSGTSGASRR